MTADRQSIGRWTLEPALERFYEARLHAGHDASGRPVRVLVYDDVDVSLDELASFGAAVEALRRVPGVLPILDWGAEEGVSFLVHEDEGLRSLESMLIDGSARGLRKSGLIEIARTLEAAHAAGIVHERLSPQTVMVDADGRPFLWGFRLKMLESVEPDRDLHPLPSLSIAYTPPEVVRGRTAGPAADAWSFALLVWRVLVGELPNLRAKAPGEPRSAMETLKFTLLERFELPSSHALGVKLGRTLEAVLAAKDPATRPGVAQIREALENS